MKEKFKEKFADIAVSIARPIINLLMKREIIVKASGDVIHKNREPFIMISNHFNTWDSFVVMRNIHYPIRFVATEIAFLDKGKNFGMSVLARAIPKRVGKVDIVATRKIFHYLKNGYAIGLFPEGDNTFYGETLEIYENTGKLLKKANVDILLVKQQGGYLSQPRWADYFSKKGLTYTDTRLLITKEELAKYSVSEVNDLVRKALYNNDYDFQKKMMIPYQRIKRAEGIERLLYFCNKCGSILSVHGEGDDIICDHCGKIGHINQYELIEGNPLDNLVDYAKLQYTHMDEIIKSKFEFEVTLNKPDLAKRSIGTLGTYILSYENQTLTLTNLKNKYVFDMTQITSPVNTMRNSFSFDYQGETWNFTEIRHQFVLFEMLRYLNGSYKS
ncbi:MAG: 1-acyl-sn-glycerol-3-phosphate acyltransferase [Firmicutes bacterium]|nr:1-acyl-sn-glycerol-3-phosphate acyltransferase [Bacillota bacterium]